MSAVARRSGVTSPLLWKMGRLEHRFGSRFRSDRVQTAEPAFASVERGQRFRKIPRFELRPPPFGEMQFGVGALPQQDVRQSFLAARPDHKVDDAQPYCAGDWF